MTAHADGTRRYPDTGSQCSPGSLWRSQARISGTTPRWRSRCWRSSRATASLIPDDAIRDGADARPVARAARALQRRRDARAARRGAQSGRRAALACLPAGTRVARCHARLRRDARQGGAAACSRPCSSGACVGTARLHDRIQCRARSPHRRLAAVAAEIAGRAHAGRGDRGSCRCARPSRWPLARPVVVAGSIFLIGPLRDILR